MQARCSKCSLKCWTKNSFTSIHGHMGRGGSPISYLVTHELFETVIYCFPSPLQALNTAATHGHIVVACSIEAVWTMRVLQPGGDKTISGHCPTLCCKGGTHRSFPRSTVKSPIKVQKRGKLEYSLQRQRFSMPCSYILEGFFYGNKQAMCDSQSLRPIPFLPAAKPSGPRAVRVIVVLGGGAVCQSID